MLFKLINKNGAILKTKNTYMPKDICIEIDEAVLGVKTDDATAEPVDIIAGKTAYVNGEKITGILTDYAGDYTGNIAISIQPEGNLEITSTEEVDVTNYATVSINEPNLKAENIRKDVSILGITGTCRPYEEPKLQEKTVTQNGEVLPDEGYDGLSKVIVDVSKYSLKNLLDTTKTCSSLFRNSTFKEVDSYLNYDDTSNVTNTNSMFYGCKELTTIPLLDTSKVTNMGNMFYNCMSLQSIPQLDTLNVTNMSGMFEVCRSLTTIPQLDTSNVTNMSNMFSNCWNLTEIPQLDTHNVTAMSGTFKDCKNLTTIPLLDTSNVTQMHWMFDGCTSLTTIPQLDTSNVTYMHNMFSNCSNLTEIPQLDTSNATTMSNMFKNCSSLTTVPLFDTWNPTTLNSMFSYCSNLESIDLTYYGVGSVINQSDSMFNGCNSLKELKIRELGPSYTIAPNAFTDCYHLTGTVNSQYNPNGDKDCWIRVPDDMVDTLRSASGWSTHASQIIGLNDIQVLEDIRVYGQAQTKPMTIRLYRNTNAPTSVSITSNNENITTITNIVTSVDRITFDLNFTGNLGSSAIAVLVVGDNNADYTFNASFVDYIPPTYTVETVEGATYGFTLNDSGYYENPGHRDSLSKLTFNNINKGVPVKLVLECIQSSYSSKNFALLSEIDTILSLSDITDLQSVYKSFRGDGGVVISKNIVYNIPEGEHFVYIKYQNTIGNAYGRNSLQFKVNFEV